MIEERQKRQEEKVNELDAKQVGSHPFSHAPAGVTLTLVCVTSFSCPKNVVSGGAKNTYCNCKGPAHTK